MGRIKMSICFTLFAITAIISYAIKPNINYIDSSTLAKEIVGVGEKKSEKIIMEREINGYYASSHDFIERTEVLGIGEISHQRIKTKYKFGD